MLALGDALAVAVSLRKGFRAEDFAELHPGGKLGKRAGQGPRTDARGDAVPVVAPSTAMTDVIYEMSSKKLGLLRCRSGTAARGDQRRRPAEIAGARGRRGVEQDGRRGNERASANDCRGGAGRHGAGDSGRAQDHFAGGGGCGRTVEGVLHLHDLWGVELV